MDIIISNLQIPIEKDGMTAYIAAVAAKLRLDEEHFTIVEIISKALDMRNLQQFYYKLTVVVSLADDYKNRQKFPRQQPTISLRRRGGGRQARPIVVGFGPAGMFAALELIAYGLKPIIIERGKKIGQRTLDVQGFIRDRKLNPESNIQFGEGGAGAYSDGKLFSRRNNNTGFVHQVLQTFIKFGAPAEISYKSKPHLGTDVLCKIVRNIREYILARGGEIHYDARMTDLLIAGGKAVGVVVNDAQEYRAESVYLALGHSARDTFSMLHARGVAMQARPISVGVRIEHPAATINLMRYGHKYNNFEGLGAATYSLNYTDRRIKRGVYTFCMCPGGEVVNASSAPGMLVLNGMSYSHRTSPFSNAALVVSCHTDDYGSSSPLAGIKFQEEIERQAFLNGGSNWRVPAQNLMDFLAGKDSGDIHENSYKMGAVASDLHAVFPDFVGLQLAAAFQKWQAQVPLFVSREAILFAAETRAASPVRITRDERYESVNIKNLYPLGEGAGYAGGITSSAADAIRAVTAQMA